MGKGLARKAWGQKIKRPEFSPETPTPANADKVVSPSTSPQAAQKAGMSAEQAQGLLEKTSTPQVKNQLRETTEAACKYGGFGLPITVVHLDGQTHMLFGSDRMELLAYLLGEKWMGPVPQLCVRL